MATAGGTFQEVVEERKKNYVAQADCLVDLNGIRTWKEVQEKIIKHCEEILKKIEDQSKLKIEKFYIGKTYLKKKKKGSGFVPFNRMKPETWVCKGLNDRWFRHKQEDYGQDGMIVLSAVTKDQVIHANPAVKKLDQEQFNLAIEQTLLHHFMFKTGETRFANTTFESGGISKEKKPGHCLYVAFTLDDPGRKETEKKKTSNEKTGGDKTSKKNPQDDEVPRTQKKIKKSKQKKQSTRKGSKLAILIRADK